MSDYFARAMQMTGVQVHSRAPTTDIGLTAASVSLSSANPAAQAPLAEVREVITLPPANLDAEVIVNPKPFLSASNLVEAVDRGQRMKQRNHSFLPAADSDTPVAEFTVADASPPQLAPLESEAAVVVQRAAQPTARAEVPNPSSSVEAQTSAKAPSTPLTGIPISGEVEIRQFSEPRRPAFQVEPSSNELMPAPQITMRDVFAWVADGSANPTPATQSVLTSEREAFKPRQPLNVETTLPARLTEVQPAPELLPQTETYQLSIGTINLIIEEPQPKTPITPPPRPASPARPAPNENLSSRLSRHYLRIK